MTDNLLHTIGLALAYLLLFSSAEFIYHRWKVKAEVTRKYVHIITGILALSFPVLITNHWLVLLLCASFFVILILTISSPFLRSIHGVDRKTSGSILYPIIVYACYLSQAHFGLLVFYYLPILILALSDPFAAFVGKSRPYGSYTVFAMSKTLSGSLAFFFSALVLCLGLFMGLENMPGLEAFILGASLALACTLAEAISHKGFDNLTIPATATLVLVVHHLLF